MTDATERRLAALLVQISEMIDSRLPSEGIKQNNFSMWQFWIVIGTMIFYSGATWIQIQDNSEAFEKHAAWDKEKTAELETQIEDNKQGLVSHMQWELEHELEAKDVQIRALKARK